MCFFNKLQYGEHKASKSHKTHLLEADGRRRTRPSASKASAMTIIISDEMKDVK